MLRAEAEQQAFYSGREQAERYSTLRGLLLIGLVILLGSIARAGMSRAFVPGWWHQW